MKTVIEAKNNFWVYFVKNQVRSIRFSFALAFILFTVSILLDVYTAPESKDIIWLIKFGVVTPFLIIAFVLTYSKVFIRYSQIVMLLMSIVMGFGVLGIIFATRKNELASQLYYSGLALCIIWTHTILRLKFSLSVFSTSLLIVGYNLCGLLNHELTKSDWIILFSNNFFLISAGMLGGWSSLATEKIFKKNFRKNGVIIQEKEELIKSKLQLLETNSVKGRLLTIISHDISSPIRSVKGILSLYNNAAISNDEFKSHARQLLDSIDQTLIMLENLLTWSTLQTENKRIAKEEINVHEAVSQIFILLLPLAARKGNRLINNISPDIYVLSEPIAMTSVIRNMVSNSIKFTENGFVEVIALETEKSIQIFIKDNGLGMGDQVKKGLFDWNVKISHLGTQREKGSGLGLLLCKEFVERQGGAISFNSELGKGSTFVVTLPLVKTECPSELVYEKVEPSFNGNAVL